MGKEKIQNEQAPSDMGEISFYLAWLDERRNYDQMKKFQPTWMQLSGCVHRNHDSPILICTETFLLVWSEIISTKMSTKNLIPIYPKPHIYIFTLYPTINSM